MTECTIVEAVNLALARAMEADERVLVLGEDVGVDGGVFRATAGLINRFGPERVRDTPLSETVIAGLSVGLAAQGFRPVAEIQFMGFIYPAIDQLVNLTVITIQKQCYQGTDMGIVESENIVFHGAAIPIRMRRQCPN